MCAYILHFIFSDDKICMKTSAVHSVVATANWIMKVSHYTVNIAHQSDTALIAIRVGLFIFKSKNLFSY